MTTLGSGSFGMINYAAAATPLETAKTTENTSPPATKATPVTTANPSAFGKTNETAISSSDMTKDTGIIDTKLNGSISPEKVACLESLLQTGNATLATNKGNITGIGQKFESEVNSESLKSLFKEKIFPAVAQAIEKGGKASSVDNSVCDTCAGYTKLALDKLGLTNKVKSVELHEAGLHITVKVTTNDGKELIMDPSFSQFFKDGTPINDKYLKEGFIGTKEELKDAFLNNVENVEWKKHAAQTNTSQYFETPEKTGATKALVDAYQMAKSGKYSDEALLSVMNDKEMGAKVQKALVTLNPGYANLSPEEMVLAVKEIIEKEILAPVFVKDFDGKNTKGNLTESATSIAADKVASPGKEAFYKSLGIQTVAQ